MHITTNFLGDVSDAKIGDVCQAVQDVARRHPPFECRLGDLGAFPKPARPRVLWLGVDQGKESLTRLHYDVSDALEQFQIERERKRFRPHLTLARLRHHERWPETMIRQLDHQPMTVTGAVTIEVDQLVVYSSFPEPGGAVYTPMACAGLGGSGRDGPPEA